MKSQVVFLLNLNYPQFLEDLKLIVRNLMYKILKASEQLALDISKKIVPKVGLEPTQA